MNLIAVGERITGILDVLKKDRKDAERITDKILKKAQDIPMELEIEIPVPRLAHEQKHRSNPPSDNSDAYWRHSLIIPYLASLTSSLNIRLSQENTSSFALTKRHHLCMTKISITNLHKNTKLFTNFCELDDVAGELALWYNLWMKMNFPEYKLRDTEVVPRYEKSPLNFEHYSMYLLWRLPLRRVKIWLRSTMGEERLTGLCLMSVPQNFVKENCEMVEKNVIDKFSANPRRLLLT
ncbi:hypothetical protein PR048_014291 [Dryococelus australis]|uniref:Uncharacterized protein n=1 Tax=Dryococelus australis TaxID=614101 RepID=A0ABQ9HDQ6_9NEOP|nr:hypothetical protein PR048_014291 [Dryococelus australis]